MGYLRIPYFHIFSAYPPHIHIVDGEETKHWPIDQSMSVVLSPAMSMNGAIPKVASPQSTDPLIYPPSFVKFLLYFFHVFLHTHSYRVPSGYVKIAIDNGHRNSGFSH